MLTYSAALAERHTPPRTRLAKAKGLFYLYIVSLMVIVWVSYGYGYTRGSGRVINNGTDINTRCVRSNSLCKLGAERANGRDAHKKLHGCTSSLFLLSLAFLPPPFLSTFISNFPYLLTMAYEYAGAFKLISAV